MPAKVIPFPARPQAQSVQDAVTLAIKESIDTFVLFRSRPSRSKRTGDELARRLRSIHTRYQREAAAL